jgi:hypothetical protein
MRANAGFSPFMAETGRLACGRLYKPMGGNFSRKP